jgi:hypothetical protein
MSEAAETAMTAYVDPEQLKKDISIDLTDLSGNMAQHSALYVFYATRTVRAKRQYERYKVAVEILEGKLDGEYRLKLKEENPKTTEGQIRAALVLDARYRRAYAQLIDAQQEYRLAEVAERSFEHRKDMLLQIARDAAKEKEGGLRVAVNQANRERMLDAMSGGAAKSSE